MSSSEYVLIICFSIFPPKQYCRFLMTGVISLTCVFDVTLIFVVVVLLFLRIILTYW